ncbi:MAG: restriction endonuclease, partial [bacterium]|nr:restriction endonuclease [bacterium]
MATKNLGFLGAAQRVLAEGGEPLHYGDITSRALANGWLETAGKTPEATLNARIASG